MKLHPFLVSISTALLLPSSVNAAAIAFGNTEEFDKPPRPLILEQPQKFQLGGLNDHLHLIQVDFGHFERENPQAYDWFSAGTDPTVDWSHFGTPVPEPSGILLFGLAGLALGLRRRR